MVETAEAGFAAALAVVAARAEAVGEAVEPAVALPAALEVAQEEGRADDTAMMIATKAAEAEVETTATMCSRATRRGLEERAATKGDLDERQ